MATKISLTHDGKQWKLIVDGHDLTEIAGRVEITVGGGYEPLVNVWIPAELSVDIPSDLMLLVDYPDSGDEGL